MNEVEIGKKRNIAVVGQHGSGKTSLLEAMLYHTGQVDRLGRINDKNTFADYFEEEKDKQMTVTSKLIHITYNGVELNFIDTPGYTDFVGDIEGAIHAADGALLVINAQSGVEVETERIWKWLNDYDKPRSVVINQMDKERADFRMCLESLESALGAKICPTRLPLGEGENFKGVIDLITDKVLYFNKKGGVEKSEDIPADIVDDVEEWHSKMIEAAVMNDEELMERYLNDEKLSYDEIRHGLHDGALSGDIVPIFVTNAYDCIGISTLLDGLVNYMPEPNAKPTYLGKKKDSDDPIRLEVSENGEAMGFVFKSMNDPYAGKVSFVRVFSGSFEPESEWVNRTKEKKERVGHILAISGKNHKSIAHARAGDIVAVSKIDSFDTNDTLSNTAGDTLVYPTEYPQAPIHMALHAKNKADEDKIGTSLPKIIAGDPTIKIERNPETHEIVLHGAGQLQLELIAQKLRKNYNLDVELKIPKVAYRETIIANGEGRYRHKKQSGGKGQFGEVQFRIKPLERGANFEFINRIFGGAIPSKFIPAVEKGVQEAMTRGIIAGYPVVDVSVEVFDGQYHDVDSSEMAFKIAASMCFRQVAREKCKPILLEPIMNVEVNVPESQMGDVMGDLNSRRGRVQGMEPIEGEGRELIKAQVPLAEMYTYSIDLRSISRGRGMFTMEFSHYDPVPHDLQEKIVAESKLEDLEEE